MESENRTGWPHRVHKRSHDGSLRHNFGPRSIQLLNDLAQSSSTPAPSDMPSEDPTPHPQTSRLSLPGLHPMNRFAGDGLDFRRPLSSTSTPIDETAVIDLTTDSEPIRPSFSESGSQTPIPTSHMRSTRPRFPHDIIDLADDNDDLYSTNYSPPTTDPTPQPPNRSPEIQFLSSRRLPVPQREAGPPYSLYQGRDIEDDEVEITGETRRVGVNTLPPFAHRPSTGSRATITSTGTRRPGLGVGGGYLTQALHRNGFHFAQRLLGPETRHPGPPYFQVNRVPTPLTFNGPGAMDFQTVGFSIGPNDDDEDRENAPPVTYEKPSPAPEGFTRSPKEDEVLVCPNCGDELCDGESDVKKQVWVLKACGHVYCGECTSLRASTKRKGKEPALGKTAPKPFKTCQVEGCGKRCSAKTQMVQLFL